MTFEENVEIHEKRAITNTMAARTQGGIYLGQSRTWSRLPVEVWLTSLALSKTSTGRTKFEGETLGLCVGRP